MKKIIKNLKNVSWIFVVFLLFGFCGAVHAESGADMNINTSLIQSDGKVIVGGRFTTYNGALKSKVARINSDGFLDTSFNLGIVSNYNNSNDSEIEAMAIQSNGKIIIGGHFTEIGGVLRNGVARLNSNGSLDTSFDPNLALYNNCFVGGSHGDISSVALQSDGKILVGGNLNCTSRSGIARLNSDGSLDTSFDSSIALYDGAIVRAIIVQSDGKVIVGGNLAEYSNEIRNGIARLNVDGSLDGSFSPGSINSSYGGVWAMAIQSDGKIIVGGKFNTYHNPVSNTDEVVNNIMRFNVDGIYDATLASGDGIQGVFDNSIRIDSITAQPDGRLIVGGTFDTYSGLGCDGLIRIFSDGSMDGSFNPMSVIGGPGTQVLTSSVQSDGKIIVGGFFVANNGVGSRMIARLNSVGTNDTSFFPPVITPTVITNSTSDIGAGSALGNGSISNAGGESPQRIIEWGTTSGNYTNSCTAGTGGVGNYSCSMTALIPNTTYYFRAKAINSAGTSYGSETSFQTEDTLYVITATAINVNTTVATIRGNIASTGGAGTVSRIIRWGTESEYYNDYCDLGNSGTGIFSCNLSGLTPNTTYYFRAESEDVFTSQYAYGEEMTFYTALSISSPAVTTQTFGVYGNSAIGAGNISNTGGENPNRSIEWGTASGNYTNSCTVGTGGVGSYNCNITGLSMATMYYARAKATNSAGTSYGSEITFYTSSGADLANGNVETIAIQSDGKIIIGGGFTTYNGVARNRIARLNVDGTLDTSFIVGTGIDGYIYATAIQSDGKIIIGGGFTTYNGVARNNVARLNVDGSLDTSFDIGMGLTGGYYAPVRTTAIQSDGKIIIGGDFTSFNGSSRNHIARINSNGSLDTTFNPGSGFTFPPVESNTSVYASIVQPDGKIIISGYFTYFNGEPRGRIARLNADGSVDTTFNSSTGFNGPQVFAIALQSDGKIMAGGYFQSYNGVTRNYSARINSDGSLDVTYNPQNGSSYVYTIGVQTNNKIFFGGSFDLYNGTNRNRVARVNTNGTLDTTFNPGTGANGSRVVTSAIQSDKKIIIGGDFTMFDGTPRNKIARLNSDGSLDTSFGNAPAITVPTLTTTSPVTLLRPTTANGRGLITSTGGENLARSIEWTSVQGNYTGASSCSAGTGGAGSYSCSMTNLTPATTYYYRASATNSAGTSKGTEFSFTTLPNSITIIDPTPAKMNSALSSNYLALESGASSATPKTTTNTAVTFQTSMASLTFPAQTDITNTDSGNFNLENFVTTNKTDEVKQTFVSTIAAVKVGVPNTKLSFSQLATLSIDVDPFYNNRPMFVFYKNDGITDDWINHTMCTITDGKCTFTTNHATTYTVKMDGSMVGETGINLNTDVQEVIALDCGTSIVNMGNLTPGNPVTGSSTCLTTTNANGGYNLSVRRDDSTDTTMDKTTEEATNITDKTSWSPSTPNATTWSGTGLGFTVYDSTANKNTTWWGTGSTVTDSNNLYAGFAPTNTDIMRHTTYSSLGTTTSIGYKLDVPPSQKSGAYSGAITYQVTTTP